MKREQSKIDSHPLDGILKLFGSSVFISLITISSVASGIALSIAFNDWLWFSRFGSIITICGLFLSMSRLFSEGIYKSHSSAGRLSSLDESGNLVTTNSSDRKHGNRTLLGIAISAFGTVVWGFGDLIGNYLFNLISC